MALVGLSQTKQTLSKKEGGSGGWAGFLGKPCGPFTLVLVGTWEAPGKTRSRALTLMGCFTRDLKWDSPLSTKQGFMDPGFPC